MTGLRCRFVTNIIRNNTCIKKVKQLAGKNGGIQKNRELKSHGKDTTPGGLDERRDYR